MEDDAVEQEVKRDLGALIDFLRKKGVMHYSAAGVTLTLLPEAPPEPVKLEAPRNEEPEKRGRDGQTKQQQIDMYGRVMDADL